MVIWGADTGAEARGYRVSVGFWIVVLGVNGNCGFPGAAYALRNEAIGGGGVEGAARASMISSRDPQKDERIS